MKRIGILGGMGPETSAEFYSKIIKYFQDKYGAIQDIDFPAMIIYSLPLEGFDETGIIDEKLVLEQLMHGIKTLENAGSDFIVIPCNTVHYFIEVLRETCSIPIFSIMEETVKKIKLEGIKSIGLLGSETTLQFNLYQKILDKNNISYVLPKPEDYEIVTKLILEVMSGKIKNSTKSKVLTLIKDMEKQSADSILLGCTELPIAIKNKDVGVKIFDSLQILAEAASEYSKPNIEKFRKANYP